MEPEHLESLYPQDSRGKEIGQLLSYVKEGNSAQLIGLPGVGRGNLLGFLAYNRNVRIKHLGENEQLAYHFVLCNFSEIKNRPLFDVMKFLFLELSSSLHERRKEEEFVVVDQMFKYALSYQDELVLFQGFKKAIDFLTLEKRISVVFLLERFETYIPLVTSEFFTNLRSIRSRAKYKFSVIFSLTRPLEDMLEPTLMADFYEFVAGHHVYLSLLDRAGISFRSAYLEKLTGQKIPEQTLAAILRLTAGHGKLTRLAMEAASSQQYKEEIITENFLLSLKTIQGALYEIWYFLTPDEQQDMLTLCQAKECPLPSQFLRDVGLIHDNNITIPLFATFVRERVAPTTPKETHISYNAETNTIVKGDLILSNKLTASEFRLLRLLLESGDEVIDRERIIETVWKDSKSFAGVSDQAVDQLIFRLRKKIEDDPNNPKHIQTVKGRGITFLP
ncbi:MAG TPA: helix-turn-helix domain-containing protein [Candidatus Saccharimonadales bacterium]|nr:helix-turn-helix domain-containing protein [Candidatus Saccharimonadales bacterium]